MTTVNYDYFKLVHTLANGMILNLDYICCIQDPIQDHAICKYVTFHRKKVLPTCGNLREIPTTFPKLSRNFPASPHNYSHKIPESHNPQFPGSRNSQPASSDSCTGVYTRYTRPKNLKKKNAFYF